VSRLDGNVSYGMSMAPSSSAGLSVRFRRALCRQLVRRFCSEAVNVSLSPEGFGLSTVAELN
jgi:hypothetical protein